MLGFPGVAAEPARTEWNRAPGPRKAPEEAAYFNKRPRRLPQCARGGCTRKRLRRLPSARGGCTKAPEEAAHASARGGGIRERPRRLHFD